MDDQNPAPVSEDREARGQRLLRESARTLAALEAGKLAAKERERQARAARAAQDARRAAETQAAAQRLQQETRGMDELYPGGPSRHSLLMDRHYKNSYLHGQERKYWKARKVASWFQAFFLTLPVWLFTVIPLSSLPENLFWIALVVFIGEWALITKLWRRHVKKSAAVKVYQKLERDEARASKRSAREDLRNL